jgi:hypothetical protein
MTLRTFTLLNIVVLLGKGEYEITNEKYKLNYLPLLFKFCKEKTSLSMADSEADPNQMREYKIDM